MKGKVTRRGAGWQYVVDVGADPATGKRRQRSKGGFPTRKEAEKALAKVNHEVNTGVFTPGTKVTFTSFVDNTWIPAISATIRPTTLESYKFICRKYLIPRIGSLRLDAITPAHLNAVYAEMITSGREGGKSGLSTRTVRLAHITVHRALRDAARWGLLGRNPADLADPPAVKRKEVQAWSPDDLRTFLTLSADEPLHTLFTLAATTGMRRGELMGLRWSDIDFVASRLAVNRAVVVANGKAIESEPKTAKSRRSVSLDPGTVAALKARRRQQLEERMVMGAGWKDTSDTVFTWPDGSPIHPDVVSKTFERLVTSYKLPRITFHGLRHSAATAALVGGIPAIVVSERLGHSSVSITLDTYSHVLPAMDEHAAAVISGLVLPTNVSNS